MKITYPVIISNPNNDEHYFVATCPIFPDLKIERTTMSDATFWVADAIAEKLEGAKEYPEAQDPETWDLGDNDQVIYLTIEI